MCIHVVRFPFHSTSNLFSLLDHKYHYITGMPQDNFKLIFFTSTIIVGRSSECLYLGTKSDKILVWCEIKVLVVHLPRANNLLQLIQTNQYCILMAVYEQNTEITAICMTMSNCWWARIKKRKKKIINKCCSTYGSWSGILAVKRWEAGSFTLPTQSFHHMVKDAIFCSH